MANVWFLGDGHFGHARILKFRPQFKSIAQHDQYILDNINSTITKRDKIWLMGDWIFTREAIDLVAQIKCPQKHLILGNHDDYRLIPEILKAGIEMSGDIKYKEFWLSHIPIHPDELRGKMNIYAHTHNATVGKPKKYFCTSCEQVGYKPVSLDEIRAHFKKHQGKKNAVISRVSKFVRWS